MIRLTSAIWFAAFMRRETSRGAFVAVTKKGAQQAGALYVVHDHLNGAASLYVPAPQALLDDEIADRQFELFKENVERSEITEYLEKQLNFDPDLWVIETEGGEGNPSLEVVEID